jgi:hypothetical protein
VYSKNGAQMHLIDSGLRIHHFIPAKERTATRMGWILSPQKQAEITQIRVDRFRKSNPLPYPCGFCRTMLSRALNRRSSETQRVPLLSKSAFSSSETGPIARERLPNHWINWGWVQWLRARIQSGVSLVRFSDESRFDKWSIPRVLNGTQCPHFGETAKTDPLYRVPPLWDSSCKGLPRAAPHC